MIKRIWPVYTLAFLLVCGALKLFQWVLVLLERRFSIEFYIGLPFQWSQDLIVAAVIWLGWDYTQLGRKISPPRFGIDKMLRVLLQGVFALVVVYQVLMFKFYALFRTFLTYDLLLQVDHWESYQQGVLQEVDGWVWFLLVCAALYLFGVFKGQPLLRRAVSGEQPPEAKKNSFIRRHFWLLGLSVYVLGIAPLFQLLPLKQDYFGLDQNPTAVLLASTGVGWFAKSATVSTHPGRGLLDKLSGSNRLETVRALKTRPLSKTTRQNLNVVVLLLESMTPAYTGIGDKNQEVISPNLTHLATSSVVLENHYCQEPASLKSLYSVLTGRYSYTTRRWQEFINRAKPDTSLAEILKSKGYSTVFMTSADGRVYSQNDFLRPRFDWVVDKNDIERKKYAYPEYSGSVDDRVLIQLLDEYLDSHPKKYFAMLYPFLPHHPYWVPGPEFERVKGERTFDRYRNSLFFTDLLVGELISVLKKHKQWEHTLLVVVSDHGEAFEQHPGNYLHSIYLYEENVHTVCLLHNPLLLSPTRYAPLTQHIDLLPTILDLLGYPVPVCDGISLARSHPAQPAFFYTSFSNRRMGLRQENMKYILDLKTGSEELYDLSQDPVEQNNLAVNPTGSCKKYREQILDFKEQVE